MIDSWEEFRRRQIEDIPGSRHARWVPYQELLPECTPQFREDVILMHPAPADVQPSDHDASAQVHLSGPAQVQGPTAEEVNVFDESLLNNPDPELIRRKLIVPLSRFNDGDIRSFDYRTWSSTEERYSWLYDERKKIEQLVKDIERNGLRNKIEIMKRGDHLYVTNGHHRVVVLKKHLGWTHIPYRWFILGSRGGTRYCRGRLPG
jgi:uncharacterized protein YlbG (UPF0298 family)